MPATVDQKTKWINSFRTWAVHYRDVMKQGQELANLYSDLGLSGTGIVDGDMVGENAGLSVSDLQAAVSVAGSAVGEFTRARETAINKISYGQP